MQLSYRGVQYDYNPANSAQAEPVQPAADLKYRGAAYRRGETAKVERLGAIFKYRGAAYSHRPIAPVEPAQPVATPAAVAPVAAITFEDKARLLTLSHNRAVRHRHYAMLSRTAGEQGFAGNVANYWNQIQGDMDTALWSDYDRSHAAFS